ncbi:hypothetical protein RRG08_028188 [Elysia crispata]|uniref:Reverse transcriptase zinc-binding domain-containing protein n=1 Tax=Elysia crispata TaxID=231223 RepID=A0AAE1ECQ6_9GAST|nr:hypothetical protein RRG08_028188 [Elysia crispata]
MQKLVHFGDMAYIFRSLGITPQTIIVYKTDLLPSKPKLAQAVGVSGISEECRQPAWTRLSSCKQCGGLRLRTGHNRLKHHLFSRFKIGDGPNCPCGASRQDAQHILQDCPQLEEARRKYWPEPREMNQKLYSSALHLGITAEFINSLDLTI